MKNTKLEKVSRRFFLKTLALSAATIVAAPVVKLSQAFAAPVDVKAPLATALGYKEDAKQAPERKDKKQFCNNCQFYKGDAKAKRAPCDLFGGAEVNAQGWCKSYSPKSKKA